MSFSATSTPAPEKIVVYPNPANGAGSVRTVFNLGGSGDVKFQIFTTAFRKIQEVDLGDLQAGTQTASFELRDSWGRPLANGVYYLVFSRGSERSVGKLLILR